MNRRSLLRMFFLVLCVWTAGTSSHALTGGAATGPSGPGSRFALRWAASTNVWMLPGITDLKTLQPGP